VGRNQVKATKQQKRSGSSKKYTRTPLLTPFFECKKKQKEKKKELKAVENR